MGSNPGHGGAMGSQVGEARCGGVGMDRPQYPRRRDRGYSVCLGVLGAPRREYGVTAVTRARRRAGSVGSNLEDLNLSRL